MPDRANPSTRWQLVPRHELLTPTEKKDLLTRYHLKDEQLPRIKSSDPVAKYYGLSRGNVRPCPSGGFVPFSLAHRRHSPGLFAAARRSLRLRARVRRPAATSRTAWFSRRLGCASFGGLPNLNIALTSEQYRAVWEGTVPTGTEVA